MKLKEVEDTFKNELAEAKIWFEKIKQDEIKWIKDQGWRRSGNQICREIL